MLIKIVWISISHENGFVSRKIMPKSVSDKSVLLQDLFKGLLFVSGIMEPAYFLKNSLHIISSRKDERWVHLTLALCDIIFYTEEESGKQEQQWFKQQVLWNAVIGNLIQLATRWQSTPVDNDLWLHPHCKFHQQITNPCFDIVIQPFLLTFKNLFLYTDKIQQECNTAEMDSVFIGLHNCFHILNCKSLIGMWYTNAWMPDVDIYVISTS